MEPVAISQSCMKQAVEIHVSGAISRVFKGGWWCCYHANKNGEKGVGGIAIHQETENAKQGTVLPVKKNLIKAVGEILFGFQDRNEIYDYPCPYVCELHINNDGTCRYRTTGADVSPWEDIHHKRNNTVTAYLAYNAKGSIDWYQAQELLLHPIGVDFIVSVLKKCGATNIDTEYITKSPCGNAGINTEGTEDGINITIEWN